VRRQRVEAQLRNLERLIDDPPPLLSLVILANGAGIAVAHPMLQAADHGTLEEREAALRLVRAFLVELGATIDERLDQIIRASARGMTGA
jgi:hypothetical protein